MAVPYEYRPHTKMVQFLKPLASNVITDYNFTSMKGDMMSKRVYHLTIEYDKETEEIEYIMETIDEIDVDHIQLVRIGSIDLGEYFDKETLKEILQNYEVGEA